MLIFFFKNKERNTLIGHNLMNKEMLVKEFIEKKQIKQFFPRCFCRTKRYGIDYERSFVWHKMPFLKIFVIINNHAKFVIIVQTFQKIQIRTI